MFMHWQIQRGGAALLLETFWLTVLSLLQDKLLFYYSGHISDIIDAKNIYVIRIH